MKKNYTEPEFKVVLTEKQDILTASNNWMTPILPMPGGDPYGP